MNEKLVSVIIPAFNAEKFISQALESVSSQTYTQWEIIAIDDGGTDRTPQIVTDFAHRIVQPVQFLRHALPLGPSAARNAGMKAARGEYIAFLDADDYWLPEHLSCLCTILSSGDVDLAYSDAYVFRDTPSGNIELLPIDTIQVTNPRVDLFRRNFINTSAAAVTRRLVVAVGDFDRTLRAGEEADYWIRSAILGFEIKGTGRQTYYYRKSAESLSGVPARMAEGAAKIYEKHRECGLLPEAELAAKARDCYFAAGKLYWRQDPSAASRAFYKAWMLDKCRLVPLIRSIVTTGLSMTRGFRRNGSRG